MLFRTLALLTLALVFATSSFAQFGKSKPTPKTAEEYFAERAMRDASRLTQGVAGRDVIRASDGIDLQRAESRMEEAFAIHDKLCADRTQPRDQWARNCFALADMYRRGLATEFHQHVAQQVPGVRDIDVGGTEQLDLSVEDFGQEIGCPPQLSALDENASEFTYCPKLAMGQ